MEAISFTVTPIGKNFPTSKMLNSWRFKLFGNLHTIDFKVSLLSNKVQLIVDGQPIKEFKQDFNQKLRVPTTIDNRAFEIVSLDSGLELYFEGQPFGAYKGRPSMSKQPTGMYGGNNSPANDTPYQKMASNGVIPTNRPNPGNPYSNPDAFIAGVLNSGPNFAIPTNPPPQTLLQPPLQQQGWGNNSGAWYVPQPRQNQPKVHPFSDSMMQGLLEEANRNQDRGGYNPAPQYPSAPPNYQSLMPNPYQPNQGSSYNRPSFQVTQTCGLETQADNFLEIEPPARKEINQVVVQMVHPRL